MSWNGSDKEKVKVEGRGQQRKDKSHSSAGGRGRPPLPWRGIAAGLIVVIGGGLAAYLMLGRPGTSAPTGGRGATRPAAIAEVKPQIATNVVEEAPKRKNYSEMSNDEKLADIRAKYGDNIPENLKQTVYFLKNPPKRKFADPPRPSHVFKRSSEREIAEFLMVEPGTWMLLKPQFDTRFDVDFAASLEEDIKINENDDDFQRELKQSVIDTKAELAERVRKGEKASDIMNDMSSELYEMGQYRQEVEKMVREVKMNPKMTDSDVEDCVNAANKMLTEKGVKPLAMPNMMFRQAALKIRSEKNKEKETQE